MALATQLADCDQFEAQLEHAAQRHGMRGVTQLVTALCYCASLCLNVVRLAVEAVDPAAIWGVAQLLSNIAGPCAAAVRHLSGDPVWEAWCRHTAHEMMSAASFALAVAAEHCSAALSAYVAENSQQLARCLDLTCSILLAEGGSGPQVPLLVQRTMGKARLSCSSMQRA